MAVWQTHLRCGIVAEAYCYAIISLVRIVKKQINFLLVFSPNACNSVASLRYNFLLGLLKPAATARLGRGGLVYD